MIDAEVLFRAFGLALIGLAGAILPISAAIREARKPRDADPLDIDSRYRKDDRYFAKSFESLLTKAIGPAPRRAEEAWGGAQRAASARSRATRT